MQLTEPNFGRRVKAPVTIAIAALVLAAMAGSAEPSRAQAPASVGSESKIAFTAARLGRDALHRQWSPDGKTTATAQDATNVVPNPGFEQGGCSDSTPDICGWAVSAQQGAFMSQDTANPHSGSASMALGWSGETGGEFGGWGADAATDPLFCAAIAPGAHAASFWDGNAGSSNGPAWVALGAVFYQAADCTGPPSPETFLGDSGQGLWTQVTGALIAPPGTESALFDLSVWGNCDNYSGCFVGANFDDLEVDDAVLTDPVIESFTPSSGLPGTTVDISGANFTGASEVAFNGVAANFTVDSDTEIHATVPDSAATGPISVTTPIGTSTSTSQFDVPPVISSFTPTCGPAGATVDILGSNFTGATSVAFTSVWYGNESATFTVVSDSEIQVIVPSAATFGPITIGTPGGATTSPSPFTGQCDSPPLVNSLTPNSGPVGTNVDIGGHYFTGATSVKFNGTAAAFTVDSDSEMHTTVPGGATTGPVSVTTPNGTTWNLYFTVTPPPPPAISIFTPPSGPVGTSVDIMGGNFTGATSVTFNGTADPSFVDNSPTDITAHVPAGATSGPISVTTPGGTVTSGGWFTVVDSTPPETTITSGPSGTVNSKSATFTFTASEPATFRCSLDGGASAACSSPKTYTGLGFGSHTFQVQATDAAGNTDPTPAQRTWTVNTPPTARFTFTCAVVTCSFDGSSSSDNDGSIQSYSWSFGDGTNGSGSNPPSHTYAQAASYTVTLTVTDNDGGSGSVSHTVTLINLRAQPDKPRGTEKVALSWSGPDGTNFDVYRNGNKIATVSVKNYSDALQKKGTYAYKVCATVVSICSNTAPVTF